MFDFILGKGSTWLRSPEDMAQFLERQFGFSEMRSKHNEWDDFENLKLAEPELERERLKIIEELGWANGPIGDKLRAEAKAQASDIIARLRSPEWGRC